MSENANFFDEMMKSWQQYLHNNQAELTANAAASFTKMQEELLKTYAASAKANNPSEASNSHELYDAITKLTNRINELEARIAKMEKPKSK